VDDFFGSVISSYRNRVHAAFHSSMTLKVDSYSSFISAYIITMHRYRYIRVAISLNNNHSSTSITNSHDWTSPAYEKCQYRWCLLRWSLLASSHVHVKRIFIFPVGRQLN